MKRLIGHIRFRKNLGRHFATLRRSDGKQTQQLLKQKYLLNPISEYLIVSSMGGVASTAFVNVIDRYSPYLVNPVIRCSIHDRLIDQKVKHLIRPLDVQTIHGFPALFSHDLELSHFRPDHIQKAIFIFGDPSLSVLSLYRRGLAWDHAVNILQNKEVNVPTTVEDYIHEGKDLFSLEKQLNYWLRGSREYECMLIKSETIMDNVNEIARFCDISEDDLRKNFKLKKRESTKTENYKQLKEHIYADLHRQIDNLPEIQIIQNHA